MNTLANNKSVQVKSLVQKIVITVDLRHIYKDKDLFVKDERKKKKSKAIYNLKQLFMFKKIKQIGIKIYNRDILNRSDLIMQ